MQGQYTVRIGAYYRVAFPSAYREKLGERIILTYGFDKSLIAASEESWKKIFAKEIEGKSFLSTKARDLRRFFLGGIASVIFDKQGRFVIPEYLRSYAQIESSKEITFVWQQEYVEVWSTSYWKEREQEVLKNIVTIAEELSKRDGQT
jgi:MraZ protein